MTSLVIGKISRLSVDMEAAGPVVTFRIGTVLCTAKHGIALSLVAMRGFPGHEVEVHGDVDAEGKRLAVTKVVTVD